VTFLERKIYWQSKLVGEMSGWAMRRSAVSANVHRSAAELANSWRGQADQAEGPLRYGAACADGAGGGV